MKKKTGLILGGVVLFSLVLVVSVVMVQAAETAASTATVTVNTFLSVTIDDSTLAFSTLDPLQTGKPTGDPLTATIGPESNVDADVKTEADAAIFDCTGSPCTPVTDTFPISNLEWSATSTFPGTDYTTSVASVCGSVAPGNDCTIYHQLTIPGNQAAGSYSVDITISVTV